MMHTHKCGFWVGDGDILLYALTHPSERPKGCGFEWSHENMDVHDVGEPAAIEAHKCPRCGAGPWASWCDTKAKEAKAMIDRKLGFPVDQEILR